MKMLQGWTKIFTRSTKNDRYFKLFKLRETKSYSNPVDFVLKRGENSVSPNFELFSSREEQERSFKRKKKNPKSVKTISFMICYILEDESLSSAFVFFFADFVESLEHQI